MAPRAPTVTLLSVLLNFLACMHSMHAYAATRSARPSVVADTHGAHAYTSQPGRHLLHGSRPDGGWVECARCNLVRCVGSRCSGHCRGGGRVRGCNRPRPSQLGGAVTVGSGDRAPGVALIEYPHILCGSDGPPACIFGASQILPSGGLPPTAVNGTAVAHCEVPTLGLGYGACVCEYSSAGGNETRSAFCEVDSPAPPALQEHWVEVYALESYYETQLPLELIDTQDVKLGDEVATIVFVAEEEVVDFVVDP